MNYSQEQMLQTMRLLTNTIASRSELAPLVGTPAYTLLTDAVASLTTHSTSQDVAAADHQATTAQLRRLRRTLHHDHLAPIAAAAHLGAATMPELAAITAPLSRLRVEGFIAAASATLDVARRYESELIAGGLPPNFLASAGAALAEFQAALVHRSQQRMRGNAATAGLTVTRRRAQSIIKIVSARGRELIGDNPSLLVEWRAATRLTRKPGVPMGTTNPSPEPAATTSAAA